MQNTVVAAKYIENLSAFWWPEISWSEGYCFLATELLEVSWSVDYWFLATELLEMSAKILEKTPLQTSLP